MPRSCPAAAPGFRTCCDGRARPCAVGVAGAMTPWRRRGPGNGALPVAICHRACGCLCGAPMYHRGAVGVRVALRMGLIGIDFAPFAAGLLWWRRRTLACLPAMLVWPSGCTKGQGFAVIASVRPRAPRRPDCSHQRCVMRASTPAWPQAEHPALSLEDDGYNSTRLM